MTGRKKAQRIARPRFKRIPHLKSSPAPYAYEVNVSYAQLIPISKERPKMWQKVVASPKLAVNTASFSKLM